VRAALSVLLAAPLALLLLGCPPPGSADGGPDRPALDGGLLPDAGPADGGGDRDGGGDVDGGGNVDGGGGGDDGGGSVDAGPVDGGGSDTDDAGVELDGGSVDGGGGTQDAGQGTDAGADAGADAGPPVFGLVDDDDLSDGDDQVFLGRRRGPESGTVTIGLATVGDVTSSNTRVFFGTAQAVCSDDVLGLLCATPGGTGVVDLTLRKPSGDQVYPGFYTYEPIDWCVLQYPTHIGPDVGDDEDLPTTLYGQLFEAGLTDASDAAAAVDGEWGHGPPGTDPGLVPEQWVWRAAIPNPGWDFSQANDELQVSVDANLSSGERAHAWRFRPSGGGVWTYCDADGTVNNNASLGNFYEPAQAGTLTVP
jgi:hypothetical protein